MLHLLLNSSMIEDAFLRYHSSGSVYVVVGDWEVINRAKVRTI